MRISESRRMGAVPLIPQTLDQYQFVRLASCDATGVWSSQPTLKPVATLTQLLMRTLAACCRTSCPQRQIPQATRCCATNAPDAVAVEPLARGAALQSPLLHVCGTVVLSTVRPHSPGRIWNRFVVAYFDRLA
jgi:hypothetical protein